MDRLLGTQVGDYRLVRRLGAGGSAVVYVGEPVAGGEPVAVKILHRRHVTDPETVRRFMDEARATSRIQHPGIVPVLRCDRSDEVGVYLVLELLEGQTLLERLHERGVLSPSGVVRVLVQVASAMEAAHAAGVIHRDLKASNVFLALDPAAPGGERARVLDFGVAKLLRGGAGTRTGHWIGTLVYMAPEQLLDAKRVDARADIYALGVLGHFLLSGRFPHDEAAIDAFLRGEPLPAPPAPEGAPTALARVLMQAMAHERDERPATMAALEAALRDANVPGDADPTLVAGPPEPPVARPGELEGPTVPRGEGTLDVAPEEMADIARAPRPRAAERPATAGITRAAVARPPRRRWLAGLALAGLGAAAVGTVVVLGGVPPESTAPTPLPDRRAAPWAGELADAGPGTAVSDAGAAGQRVRLRRPRPDAVPPRPRRADALPPRRPHRVHRRPAHRPQRPAPARPSRPDARAPRRVEPVRRLDRLDELKR